MPRSRFTNLPDDRRREILDEAAGEFALHGYERASLNRILSAASLSKGSFYYYFEDKADLFATVVQDTVASCSEALLEFDLDLSSLRADSFWEQLQSWSDQTTERLLQIPHALGLAKLAYQPLSVEGASEVITEQYALVQFWLDRLVERGRELRVIRDDVPLGLQQSMVMGALQGADRWFVEHWDALEAKDQDEASASVRKGLQRMLGWQTSEAQGRQAPATLEERR
ncbi:MAG: TetR/AcrR family transcriptional regulator [Acidobacteriota bacterium]